MRLALPKPQLSLRAMVVLVAILAFLFWVGLNFWSPTRRLRHFLRPDQPVYLRREAASSLGRDVPSWEVDRAVLLLIRTLGDTSPRVREYAGVGLSELGTRADAAIPKIIVTLNDEDRFVRFSMARTLGFVVDTGSAKRVEAMSALVLALEDSDPEVRLAVAESLIKLGATSRTVETLVAACNSEDAHIRDRARRILISTKNPTPFIPAIVNGMNDRQAERREGAYQTLLLIAPPKLIRGALTSALTSDDPEIRRWAAEKLERITPAH